MLKQEELKLAALFKQHRFGELESFSSPVLECLSLALFYTTNIKPNLDPLLDNPLLAKEMFALILLVKGKTPHECADLLGLAYSSVLTYEKRIRKKLGTRSRAESFYVALLKGYLTIVH